MNIGHGVLSWTISKSPPSLSIVFVSRLLKIVILDEEKMDQLQ